MYNFGNGYKNHNDAFLTGKELKTLAICWATANHWCVIILIYGTEYIFLNHLLIF